MMMSTAPTIRSVMPETFAERIHDPGERYGVRKIRVFGSFAREEAGPDSDIDLVVEYVPGKGGFAFVEFCEQVEKLLRRKVDVVTERVCLRAFGTRCWRRRSASDEQASRRGHSTSPTSATRSNGS